jgi:flavodoxin
VAYFSRYGNTNYNGNVDAVTSASIVVQDGEQQGTTELIARMIAEETGGDLHLIETVDAYPTDFNDVVDQNHQEAADGTRPALTGDIDVSGYDVIFIGYPVWASSTPTPVLSFLESHDLSGKTVIPFCTHNGYGAGNSYSAVAQASTGATVGQGLAIEANDAATSQQTVEDWLNRMELPAHNEQKQGETAIRITIGNTVLEGVLYDSDLARQFVAQLPQTISMSNYGGREVYGSIDQRLTVEGSGQLRFDNGDITYCPSNNTAAIFYAQTDRPDLTMEVYPIGKVTSDLSVFPNLPSRVDITFEVV